MCDVFERIWQKVLVKLNDGNASFNGWKRGKWDENLSGKGKYIRRVGVELPKDYYWFSFSAYVRKVL